MIVLHIQLGVPFQELGAHPTGGLKYHASLSYDAHSKGVKTSR